MQSSNDKQHAVELLNRLDAGQLAAVVHLLEVMSDPVARAAASAPLDDEPVTDEDRRRFRQGQDWFQKRGGRGVSMDDVLAGFGLKTKDFNL